MNNQPWLPYRAIDYIKRLQPSEVFEWGSGGSTLFWTQLKSVRHLVSIEHDPEWFEDIKPCLPDWVDYQYVPAESGEIGPDKANPDHYKSGSTVLGEFNFRRYAQAIDGYGLFDLILIDGLARPSCIKHAVTHVAPGGCLVIDNTGDRPYYLEQAGALFGNYETGWERVSIMGYGPILEYQWETTFFFNITRDNYA